MYNVQQKISSIFIIVCFNIAIINATEYKFVSKEFEKVVEEDGIISTDDLKHEKNGDDIIFNGEVKQFVDFDNTWQFRLIVERSIQEGKFTTSLLLPPMGVCTLMVTHYKNHFYEKLKQHANAPDPDQCPVTAETYTVNNYTFDTTAIRNKLKPGQYRIRFVLLKDGKIQAEYALKGDVIAA